MMNKEEEMWIEIWNQLKEDKMKPPSQREIKYVSIERIRNSKQKFEKLKILTTLNC